jgi:hypothetical protein
LSMTLSMELSDPTEELNHEHRSCASSFSP